MCSPFCVNSVMTEIVVIEQCFRNRWEARFHLSMGKVFLSARGKHRDLPRDSLRAETLRAAAAQRFSGNACRICGNTFAMALPTHYCDELTYLRMAAEWDSRASGGAAPSSS